MAVTFTINNDLSRTSIDMMDATKAHILRGSSVAVGDDPDGFIIETLTLGFAGSYSDDSRATWMRDFKQMMAAAKSHYDLFLVDKAVWIEFKPESATNTQYAKIRNGGVQRLGTNIIGGHEGAKFTVWIEREVAWRNKAPDGTAGDTIHSSVTSRNKSDGDGDNWLDWTGQNNDMPGFTLMNISAENTWDEIIIAKKVGSTTDLDKFHPWFNGADEDGGETSSAQTAAPGDTKLEIATTNTLEWNFTNANIEYFTGNYLLYTYMWRFSGAGTATVKYIIEYDGSDVFTSDAITLPTSEQRTYLGRLSLPGTGFSPFLSPSGTNKFKLEVTVSGTATFYYYTSWIIPVDFPPYSAHTDSVVATNRAITIDGINDLTYMTLNTNVATFFGEHIPTPNPPYPTTAEDENTRFYHWIASGETVNFNDAVTIWGTHVKRFAAVEGGV